jgi:hypothetical protein
VAFNILDPVLAIESKRDPGEGRRAKIQHHIITQKAIFKMHSVIFLDEYLALSSKREVLNT